VTDTPCILLYGDKTQKNLLKRLSYRLDEKIRMQRIHVLEIILVLGIITAGCIGSSFTLEPVNSTTTPVVERTVTFTQNPTPVTDNKQDSIIGVWRENYSFGYDDRYQFLLTVRLLKVSHWVIKRGLW
jgi:hypothetical protein